jgi:hypothetical protein
MQFVWKMDSAYGTRRLPHNHCARPVALQALPQHEDLLRAARRREAQQADHRPVDSALPLPAVSVKRAALAADRARPARLAAHAVVPADLPVDAVVLERPVDSAAVVLAGAADVARLSLQPSPRFRAPCSPDLQMAVCAPTRQRTDRFFGSSTPIALSIRSME